MLFGSQLIATGLIAQMLNVVKKGEKPYRMGKTIPGDQKGKRCDFFIRTVLDKLWGLLMTNFSARPLHLFGMVGLIIGAFGFMINLYIVILKFITGDTGGHYTLLLMGVTLMVFGFQWFSTGLLGEIINNLQQKHNDRQKTDITFG
jgi:hypothetical protein